MSIQVAPEDEPIDRSGVPVDLPLVDVDIHQPTEKEVIDYFKPPGISIKFDKDVEEILKRMESVHDFFSNMPSGSDVDAWNKAMARVVEDLGELKRVTEERVKSKRAQKTMFVVAFFLGVAAGRSR